MVTTRSASVIEAAVGSGNATTVTATNSGSPVLLPEYADAADLWMPDSSGGDKSGTLLSQGSYI